MPNQVSKECFEQALKDLGHNPNDYRGKRLTLVNLCDLYELQQDTVLDAIDQDLVAAHYDYKKDTIWVDALDAAHFYYCMKSKVALYQNN